MDTFRKLKEMRKHLVFLPGMKAYKDFDIAVEIGYHERLGEPLTLKQLLLLDVTSPASVRRHLNKMITNGVVVKHSCPYDQRLAHYILSEKAHNNFKQCLSQISCLLATT